MESSVLCFVAAHSLTFIFSICTAEELNSSSLLPPAFLPVGSLQKVDHAHSRPAQNLSADEVPQLTFPEGADAGPPFLASSPIPDILDITKPPVTNPQAALFFTGGRPRLTTLSVMGIDIGTLLPKQEMQDDDMDFPRMAMRNHDAFVTARF
ncbi:hypothetical protein RvY_03025 [Ramazzottius varieornatus]|uniref:Uncharacterized protein n=1 Tax=Ramazzottius varieornatus TaxID=947166 RepID=A0A1D1ULN8_RAMVA|nr:hypothetical protein RvY_03025 [Ramazzottius varieornatus]